MSAAATILAKVHESGTPRVSYAFEQWLFHYMCGDDQSYLAVAVSYTHLTLPTKA